MLDWFAKQTYRQARRVVVAIIGTTVSIVGLAMIVLPGPAIVVIPVGLAILATEFVWAARLLKRLKRTFTQVKTVVLGPTHPQTPAPANPEGTSPAAALETEENPPRL